jgi:saccharopine dehydrogenase (NAD+, L-lysine-forming)
MDLQPTMKSRALLYGATGFTGRLLVQRLVALGVDVVLAGRNQDKLRALAGESGLEWRAFELAPMEAIESALAGIDVVLHAAGPFTQTAAPMMSACLRRGAHYLDLAGEWPVFQDAMALDGPAHHAGLMLMPGVGLSVAVTDCLLALAVRRHPDTVTLRLGVSRPEVLSRGTVVSGGRIIGPEALIRRDGRLKAVPGGILTHAFDFGQGLREATALSWPDVVTGEFTTGVGNIEIYTEAGWLQRASYRATSLAMAFTGVEPWRMMSDATGALWRGGPSAGDRRRAGYVMVVEAVDPWRRIRRLRMRTLDGYSASVLTAAAAVARVLSGDWSPGFQTPARRFGNEFIFEAGCAILDESSRRLTGEQAV